MSKSREHYINFLSTLLTSGDNTLRRAGFIRAITFAIWHEFVEETEGVLTEEALKEGIEESESVGKLFAVIDRSLPEEHKDTFRRTMNLIDMAVARGPALFERIDIKVDPRMAAYRKKN